MSGRRLAVAALATVALAAGVLVASGTGSTARSWAWGAGTPGVPIPAADGRDGLRLLVADDDFALVAREEEGAVAVGAGAGDDVPLESLEQLAGDDPLVAFAATTPEGGPQQLVGVARSDVDHVDAVLRDGTTVELPLNEWRAFSYTAPTSSQAAVGLVGRSTDGALGMVRVPQTTAVTQQAPAPSAYTISNRGRPVTARPSSGLQRLFTGIRYRLYLLATRNGRAFYRVQVTPRFTCWAAGKASRIGEIGALACPNLVGTYPLQFEDVAYGAHLPSTRPRDPSRRRDRGRSSRFRCAPRPIGTPGRPRPRREQRVQLPRPLPEERRVRADRARRLREPPRAAARRPAPDAAARHLRPAGHERSIPPSSGTSSSAGTSEGVTVSVGNNRTVVFNGDALAAATRKALRADHIGFHCFQIGGQNVRNTRDVWTTAPWRPPVAFRVVRRPDTVRRLRHPGHVRAPLARRTRHPQPRRGPVHGARAPLLRRPRDRARSRALRPLAHDPQLRTLTGQRLVAALRRAYGDRVVVLPRADALPPPGLVGVHASGDAHRLQRAQQHRQPTVRRARAGQDRRRQRPRARVRILRCASCNSAIFAASPWPYAWRHLPSFQPPARSRPTG